MLIFTFLNLHYVSFSYEDLMKLMKNMSFSIYGMDILNDLIMILFVFISLIDLLLHLFFNLHVQIFFNF